jgi:hypothetical protein
MKKLEDIKFVNGQAIESMSWAEFLEFVNENENLKGYIFRGHERTSWPLTSTFYRALRKRGWKPGVDPAPDPEILNKQLRWFLLSIRGRISLQEREASSANEVWAIGQHHGLATPLLDWTAAPLVAAFFGFGSRRLIQIAEISDDVKLDAAFTAAKAVRAEPRAIIALNAKRINEVFYEAIWKSVNMTPALKAEIERLRPLGEKDDAATGSFLPERIAERLFPADDRIRHACTWAIDSAECDVARIISPLSGENRRLISQRGMFTKLALWMPLEQWVGEHFSGEPGKHASDERILLKIEIPEPEQQNALRHLEAANINHLSLFPDVEGAALYSNVKIRMKLPPSTGAMKGA